MFWLRQVMSSSIKDGAQTLRDWDCLSLYWKIWYTATWSSKWMLVSWKLEYPRRYDGDGVSPDVRVVRAGKASSKPRANAGSDRVQCNALKQQWRAER